MQTKRLLPTLLLWACWLLMFYSAACSPHAAKKPPKSAYPVQIPVNCVVGGYANRSFCSAIEGSADLVLCKDIILKYACLHVVKKEGESEGATASPDSKTK